MQNTIYGYIRVSTKEQNEARQKIALQNFPVREENIFMDKQSGKDFNRTSYRKLLKKMRKKDILVAQNERENIRKRQAEGIAAAKERGVHFGNPGKPVPVAFEDVAGKWRRKEISLSEALRELEIGRTYFYKNVKLLGL
ncbi:recombinase family protein [Lachnospiraceae bacterium 54-11]